MNKVSKELLKIAREINIIGKEMETLRNFKGIADQPHTQYENFTGKIHYETILGNVSNARFSLMEGNEGGLNSPYMIFGGGTWERGTAERAWLSRCHWKNGMLIDGEFQNGTWERGTMEKVQCQDVIWKNGIFIGGSWYKGTWKDGVWITGDWWDGTW